MSRLYPARRIPQGMVLIGSVFIILSFVTAMAHWVFDVSIIDRNTGEPVTDASIAFLVAAFACVGVMLMSLGLAILRIAVRHQLAKSRTANGG